MKAEPGYRLLASVLNDALNQAQSGKGKERHACGEPFEQQEICHNTRAVGFGYPLGQARKKAREAKRLFETRGKEAAIAECLGAINYLAAAVIVMGESQKNHRFNDHSERTAADELEETLLWRQKGLANHTYTDEEPEHRIRYRDSAAPSDVPYSEIPVTEQEDEGFEVLSVRRG
jgi:hypothetical protein